MTTYDFASKAKLLTVHTNVVRNVVRALNVLQQAKEEGLEVDHIFAQFFTDKTLKNMETLPSTPSSGGNPSASSSSSTLLDPSPQGSDGSVASSSSPPVEEAGKGKRRREDTNPGQAPNEVKRPKLENDEEDVVLQDPQENEKEKVRRQWKELLPDLSAAYRTFHRKVQDGTFFRRTSPTAICLELDCQKYEKSVCCFYNDQYSNVNVTYCACENINNVLVLNGLFPTSPSSLPQIAISTEVLDLADGVEVDDMDDSVSRILMDTYTNCEVPLTVDYKGDMVLYEFRNALVDALPWYRELKNRSIAEVVA